MEVRPISMISDSFTHNLTAIIICKTQQVILSLPWRLRSNWLLLYVVRGFLGWPWLTWIRVSYVRIQWFPVYSAWNTIKHIITVVHVNMWVGFCSRSCEQVALSGFTWESWPPYGFGLGTCWVLTVWMPWDMAPTMSSQSNSEAYGMWRAGGERPMRGQSNISFRTEKLWKTTGEEPDHECCRRHPQHNSMQPLRLVASATVQAVQSSRKWCSRPGPLIGARSQIGYQSETR